MNKILEKLKTKNKILLALTGILLIIYIFTTIHLIYSISLYNGVENFLRILAIIILILLESLFSYLTFLGVYNNKKIMHVIMMTLISIFSISQFYISDKVSQIFSKIDNINKEYSIYSTSIVVLEDSDIKEVGDIKDKKIGIINDTESIDGYQISQDIINKNKLEKNEFISLESFPELLASLYAKEIDAVFLPTGYEVMFKGIEAYENISLETRIIVSMEKRVEKKDNNLTVQTNNKSLQEPFTILLMGVDSVGTEIQKSSFNGDALMLITFNPITLNSTVMSIPRDSYVPIACFKNQKSNKITHAAWSGEKCMIDTIQNWMDIEIDYYIKINFKGVVNLVDALGGVEVDIPHSFCEQNSNRQWGDKTVFVDAGYQTLNGEQALAYARHRKVTSYMKKYCGSKYVENASYWNDFTRGKSQQAIITAILNKIKVIRNVDTLIDILDQISVSMDTNMTTDQILSFYNIGKDILSNNSNAEVSDLLGMNRLQIKGYDQYIYESSMRLELYNFVPYKGSVKDVSTAMRVNLGLEKPTLIKNFSFDADEEYEVKVIGQGNYNESKINLVPNFVDKKLEEAQKWGSNNNVTINVEYVTAPGPGYVLNQITSQSVHKRYPVSEINKSNGITVTVVNNLSNNNINIPTETIDCSLEENKDHSKCQIQDFTNKSYEEFQNWKNSLSSTVSDKFTIIKILGTDPNYDVTLSGMIKEQTPTTGSLYDVEEIKITYMEKGITVEPDDEENPDNENVDDDTTINDETDDNNEESITEDNNEKPTTEDSNDSSEGNIDEE